MSWRWALDFFSSWEDTVGAATVEYDAACVQSTAALTIAVMLAALSRCVHDACGCIVNFAHLPASEFLPVASVLHTCNCRNDMATTSAYLPVYPLCSERLSFCV